MTKLPLRAALALGLGGLVGALALACEDTAGPARAASPPAASAVVAADPAPDGAFTGIRQHGFKIETDPRSPVKIVSANVYLDSKDGDGQVAGHPAKSFVDWHTHPGPTMVIVAGGTLTMHHAHDCNRIEHFRPGAVFFAPKGVHLAANDGPTDIVLRATFFLPPDAPPTVLKPDAFTACGL
ncbi:MAG TPA: hypothetical protein VFG66_09485 [Gemmatimonadales bacterium]|nr:hypothetical protein [Gemmatimonadales bacterium]